MNNKFMKRAIELSRTSIDTGGGPFGAVITLKDEIISETSATEDYKIQK